MATHLDVWTHAAREADLAIPLPGADPLLFRLIPACPEGFLMGSRGNFADEEPMHRVCIPQEFAFSGSTHSSKFQ